MTENIGHESRQETTHRRRWGMLFVLISFVVAIAAGIGFLVVYWTHGSNMWLGGTLAIFFGGLGWMLVIWSHMLMSHKEVVDPRETLASEAHEVDGMFEDINAGQRDIHRRNLLKWLLAGGAGVIAAMAISLISSVGESPNPQLDDTIWKRGQRLMTQDGKPVTVDFLEPGSTVVVFPEDQIGSERAQTVLIRVHPQHLDLSKKRADWAPMGYVAYSRVCTHAGCPVGLYEASIDTLLCPCHQSTFNVLRGAQPTGGPAARTLPQLPLYADADGTLRARGGFTAPPGPGFWGMPS